MVNKTLAIIVVVSIALSVLIVVFHQTNKSFQEPYVEVVRNIQLNASGYANDKHIESGFMIVRRSASRYFACDAGVALVIKNTGKLKAENVTLRFKYPPYSHMRAYLIKNMASNYERYQNNIYIRLKEIPVKTNVEIKVWSAVKKEKTGTMLNVTMVSDASNVMRKQPAQHIFSLKNLSKCNE